MSNYAEMTIAELLDALENVFAEPVDRGWLRANAPRALIRAEIARRFEVRDRVAVSVWALREYKIADGCALAIGTDLVVSIDSDRNPIYRLNGEQIL